MRSVRAAQLMAGKSTGHYLSDALRWRPDHHEILQKANPSEPLASQLAAAKFFSVSKLNLHKETLLAIPFLAPL